MKWKMSLVVAFLVCVSILAGCGGRDAENLSSTEDGGESVINGDSEDSVLSPDVITSLEELDGWWYKDVYDPEVIGVQIFEVDSKNKTATAYNNYGKPLMDFDVRMEEGNFVMNNELFRNVYFKIMDPARMFEVESGDMFYRGEPLDPTESVDLSGNWTLFGVPAEEASKTLSFGGTNYARSIVAWGESTVLDEGEYTISDTTVSYFVGDPVTYVSVKLGDWGSLTLSADGLVLTDSLSGDYFLKESAIGTPEGEQALVRSKLANNTWYGDTDTQALALLYISENGVFLYKGDVDPNESHAWSADEDAGTWAMDGSTAVLHWHDGTVDSVTLTADELSGETRFTVDSLGVKFGDRY